MYFAHEIQCAYRLNAEHEKLVNKQKRNQYKILLKCCFSTCYAVLYFAYKSLKIFQDGGIWTVRAIRLPIRNKLLPNSLVSGFTASSRISQFVIHILRTASRLRYLHPNIYYIDIDCRLNVY